MCVSFGSLAQQGFLAGFPGRTEGAGKTCFGGKDRRRRAFFDVLTGGCTSIFRLLFGQKGRSGIFLYHIVTICYCKSTPVMVYSRWLKK